MRLSAVSVAVFVGCSLAVLGVACSIGIQRDLSAIPPGQVGFDDMCGLQDYFDALEIKTSPPPRVVSAVDLEGSGGAKVVQGGRERYAFENDFQLEHLRRVLAQNWKRLPDPVATASAIEIEVRWSEKAGTKRVLTDQEAELSVGQETWALPYHVCLSEMLYGEPLYRQRRIMWNLPLPKTGAKTAAPADGGAAPTGDAGPASAPADGSADGNPSTLK